jgi:hypothetical protein
MILDYFEAAEYWKERALKAEFKLAKIEAALDAFEIHVNCDKKEDEDGESTEAV